MALDLRCGTPSGTSGGAKLDWCAVLQTEVCWTEVGRTEVESLRMRIPIWLTLVAALVAVALVIIVGQFIIQPPRSLITGAAFAPQTITPNADGSDDVTILSYGLSRSARVTISLTDANGQTYAFRQDEPRIPQDYNVAFSGVVDGFTLPDEDFGDQQILRRLIPDGVYTWRVQAVDTEGATDERSGTLTIQDGDSPLPELTEFTVPSEPFTPNQDGIYDRVQINAFLSKDADLKAYLLSPLGEQFYLSEVQDEVLPNMAGRHRFDYDGGVDNRVDPPPDGTYEVVAVAQDAVGQKVQRTGSLTIADGGKPYAQIVPQTTGVTVVFEPRPWDERFLTTRNHMGELVTPPDDPALLSSDDITMTVGDMLVFKLTVENYGDVAIRTTGPVPGTVYQWDQRASTLGLPDQAGAWRVGIDCTTAMSDYPWRWALGDETTLQVVHDEATGNTYYYLPAGARAVVWGAVHMTQIEAYNPQNCWAGLIHEQVEISQVNQNVGPRSIRLEEMP